MSGAPRAPAGVPARVLLALEESGVPDVLFDVGALLARRATAPLIAVAREDADLMAAAALPFVAQVERGSGRLRQFTPAALAQARRRSQARWQQRLHALAREYALDCALEPRTCTAGMLLQAVRETSDVLLLGSPVADAPRRARAPRILAVCRDGGSDDSVVAAATLLAAHFEGVLHLLECGSARQVPGLGIGRLTREVVSDQPAAIVAAACAARGEVLVLSRGADLAERALLAPYLARPGRCIVLLP